MVVPLSHCNYHLVWLGPWSHSPPHVGDMDPGDHVENKSFKHRQIGVAPFCYARRP